VRCADSAAQSRALGRDAPAALHSLCSAHAFFLLVESLQIVCNVRTLPVPIDSVAGFEREQCMYRVLHAICCVLLVSADERSETDNWLNCHAALQWVSCQQSTLTVLSQCYLFSLQTARKHRGSAALSSSVWAVHELQMVIRRDSAHKLSS
jgi:hypothetical protein